jgi:hypothetical protein
LRVGVICRLRSSQDEGDGTDEQGPAVLQVGDQGHADDAQPKLDPAASELRRVLVLIGQ